MQLKMLNMRVWLVVLCLMFTCCLFCEGKGKKKSIKALTYNTWLQESRSRPFLEKESRKANMIKGIIKSKADIVCLQEVYFGRDLEDIVKGVKKRYPYSFSELHTAVNKFPAQAKKTIRPPCNEILLTAHITCLRTSGCNYTDEKQNAACLRANCKESSLALFNSEGQKCITCMSMSLVNLDSCANKGKDVEGGRQINNGGLLLLSTSKLALSKASYNDFHISTKESIPRGYIKAEIKNVATVACVHMSRVVKDTFLEPDLEDKGFESYSEMNTFETNLIINKMKGENRVILMGGMNMGPKFKSGQISNLKSNYEKLKKNFETKPVKGFTFKNPRKEAIQSVVDHVFVRGFTVKASKRMFVPKEGERPWSDHVGVLSTLKMKK